MRARIPTEVIIGAIVEEVIEDSGYIECIKLTLPDGRSVDIVAEKSRTDILEAPWMEVL